MAAQTWDDLDELFSCPAVITDQKLRDLYQALYARVTNELETVELSTAQLIQGSLMMGWTVKHLNTSRKKYQAADGYRDPGQEKDAIMALEGILRDWNDTMHKARVHRDRTRVGVPVEVIQEVLAQALSKLPADERVPIIGDIATALSEYTT
jgi:hypothetical protein